MSGVRGNGFGNVELTFNNVGHGFNSVGVSFNSVGHGFNSVGVGFNNVGVGFNIVGQGFNSVGVDFNSVGEGFNIVGLLLNIVGESLNSVGDRISGIKLLKNIGGTYMDDDLRRHHERNGRVKEFGIDNAADFVSPNPGGALFAEIGTHYDNANGKDAIFTEKFGAGKAATTVKTGTKTELLTWIDRMAIAADSMRDLHPGINDQFPRPRNLNQPALLARGRADYLASAPYADDFINYGSLPNHFRDMLNTACDDFEAATAAQGTEIDERVAANAEVEDEVEQANRKVRLLDGIVRSKYYGNPGKLAAWASASHAEAAPKKKKSGGGDPPTP